MKKDYIYIKLCGNESIKSNNIKVKLKDKCNKIVFEGMTDNFGKIKIPILAKLIISFLFNFFIYSIIIYLFIYYLLTILY